MEKLKERGLGLLWNINVIGLSDNDKKEIVDLVPGESIFCNSRTNNNRDANDRVSIAVLSSPSDELIDLTPIDIENAKKLDAEGNLTASAVRAYRGHHAGERQDRCILNIVPLNVDTETNPVPFIGYNVIFPDYGKGISIHCQANHVYVENYVNEGESDE